MALVTMVAQEIDAMAGELSSRLEVVEAELSSSQNHQEASTPTASTPTIKARHQAPSGMVRARFNSILIKNRISTYVDLVCTMTPKERTMVLGA